MKHWDNYRIYRWPIHEVYKGLTRYEYNPQHFDEKAGKWRPATFTKDGKVFPRLYKTRLEAEQWIEVKLMAERKQNDGLS